MHGTATPHGLPCGFPIDAATASEESPVSHVTTADGTRLHVKDWGQGRPIVLIHGWPLSADSWDPLADAFAAVLEQTNATDAILVGFSMGGGEVARYMSRHRGRGVAKVALVASVL